MVLAIDINMVFELNVCDLEVIAYNVNIDHKLIEAMHQIYFIQCLFVS